MGRKVHPYGFRLGITTDWRARWYAEGKEYGDQLIEDQLIRNLIRKDLGRAGISDVEIERFPKQVSVTIHTAKPGIIIGRKGASVELLRKDLAERTGKTVKVDVVEISSPETSAPIVAQSMAQQLERRISHKRAMKQTAFRAVRAGAQGIKIVCSGRLGGSEMSRTDKVIRLSNSAPSRVPVLGIDTDPGSGLLNNDREVTLSSRAARAGSARWCLGVCPNAVNRFWEPVQAGSSSKSHMRCRISR